MSANDYGWGLFRKGMKRRAREVRRMRIMTCLAVFFLAFTLLLQDNLNACRMEMNFLSYGSWAARSEGDSLEDEASLEPCGEVLRGSMIYRAYPKDSDVDPATGEPYGGTQYESEPSLTMEIGFGDNSRCCYSAIGTFTKEFAEEQHVGLYTGRWPEADGEIVMELSALEELGASYELGQELTFYLAERDDVHLLEAECERAYLAACEKWREENPGIEPPTDEKETGEDDEEGFSLSNGADGLPVREDYSIKRVFGSKKLYLVRFTLVGTVERYSVRWDSIGDLDRADLPSAIVTGSDFDRLKMDKITHSFYTFSPVIGKNRLLEIAPELLAGYEKRAEGEDEPITVNLSAYTATFWGNPSMYRDMTILLIVLSACIIAYLMASYLIKRRTFFLRMREIGASTGEVFRMSAYECVLSVLPAVPPTLIGAYAFGLLASFIVSLAAKIRFFFVFSPRTLLFILGAIAATLVLALGAALIIFAGRGISEKKKGMSRASAKGIKRRVKQLQRGNRAYLGLTETLARDRRAHRVKTFALRIVAILACAVIILCSARVSGAAQQHAYMLKKADVTAYTMGVVKRRVVVPILPNKYGRTPRPEQTTYQEGPGDCFTLKKTFDADFIREVEGLHGVRSVKWYTFADEHLVISFDGKETDPFFQTLYRRILQERNPMKQEYGELDLGEKGEKYMKAMEPHVIRLWADSEPEELWSRFRSYLGKAADYDAFERGEQVIVAVDMYAQSESIFGLSVFRDADYENESTNYWEELGHSFEPGDTVGIECLNGTVEAVIAGIVPMKATKGLEGFGVTNNETGLFKIICSGAFAERAAQLSTDSEEPVTGFNIMRVIMDEISVNENTVKSISNLCAKFNLRYYNEIEMKLETRDELIRSVTTYGLFGAVLAVLFFFVFSSVARDENARLGDKYRFLLNAGMTERTLKRQKRLDALVQSLWLLLSLPVFLILSILQDEVLLNAIRMIIVDGEEFAEVITDLGAVIRSLIRPGTTFPCLAVLMLGLWFANICMEKERRNEYGAEKRA